MRDWGWRVPDVEGSAWGGWAGGNECDAMDVFLESAPIILMSAFMNLPFLVDLEVKGSEIRFVR